ncbi:DUF1045 domain-containing protein [Aquabacter cavernae]|uniref:DUF1045 domain-containing protein n=1 Tax=Aquabacter cavernae TaxID=2496029 RepID=UPI001FE15BB6|nr:DUF1045 domain-containing protein [Aquabacter cavernae]
MTARYAVYLAPPPDSFLWSFGSRVVGYDAATGCDLPAPDLSGFDGETWRRLTAEPRRYGFHGTLKAPFRLAGGMAEADLISAVDAFAGGHHTFELAALEVTALGSFVALVPGMPTPALSALAEGAVEELDGLRAPLTPAEVARRRPDDLSARQREHLARYGYPYVFEDFRFHMTLTGPLSDDQRPHAFNALSDAYAVASAHLPVAVADVCVFRQEQPDERFRILHRALLRTS